MNSETELKEDVVQLLDEVQKTHRYSMSRIYNLYNRVFGTNETPQSCASCLIRKVRQLTQWYAVQVPEVVEEQEKPKRKKRNSNQ